MSLFTKIVEYIYRQKTKKTPHKINVTNNKIFAYSEHNGNLTLVLGCICVISKTPSVLVESN